MAHFAEVISTVENTPTHETIVLGGGCFWCVEAVFVELKGVHRAVSGYSGGSEATANYEAVCSKQTDHIEVVLVEFDPSVITARQILEVFFTTHDPTTPNRQGNDVGPQYRSAVFYTTTEQQELAKEVMATVVPDLYGAPAVTEVRPYETFYAAEAYHQDYYSKVGSRNSYCSFVITPKVSKFRKQFAELRK
ncbi:peptide-methionine (S)-S-oxide reductase MsrA [Neolewinella lacunae]|uniref:Peptide methionine sulfoxide reductase MsrA n=1 Tax=Neolewinella lacunae TaxID=1517758 RepID=A0A923PKK2_9BACT|nr:peptide-methionine (S)-S-oxide reductase MsrA [Neolewinella lacunae]MBC6995069.1 peptide-methionine (S)-S-oxide reductase MsrA [Neolewinella lacunae]MDN3635382.1 peptide-methionine (S)-S-oxide reductase MsrA [Neolewinella lacunae]